MLKIAIRRLGELLPHAQLRAITREPARLASHFPHVEPVPELGRRQWFQSGGLPGGGGPLNAFCHAARNTDLYVVAGMGSFTSAFEPPVLDMIRTIPLLRRYGASCVAFSQGIGPIARGSATWHAAAEAFSQCDLIALREGVYGRDSLRELGVAHERVVVTGDDSIELAYERRGPKVGNSVGVALRSSGYSSITPAEELAVAATVRRLAAKLRAGIVSTPVSHVPEEADAATFERMYPDFDGAERPHTPEALIAEIGRCRFVITGAYHAAVLALSQGIPAVCLAKSPYYRDKFLGLAAQFRSGCAVFDLSQSSALDQVAAASHHFWVAGAGLRRALLSRAAEQIRASRAAWRRLPRLRLLHATA